MLGPRDGRRPTKRYIARLRAARRKAYVIWKLRGEEETVDTFQNGAKWSELMSLRRLSQIFDLRQLKSQI